MTAILAVGGKKKEKFEVNLLQKCQIYKNNMGKNFNISGHEFLKYKISVL